MQLICAGGKSIEDCTLDLDGQAIEKFEDTFFAGNLRDQSKSNALERRQSLLQVSFAPSKRQLGMRVHHASVGRSTGGAVRGIGAENAAEIEIRKLEVRIRMSDFGSCVRGGACDVMHHAQVGRKIFRGRQRIRRSAGFGSCMSVFDFFPPFCKDILRLS